MDDNYMRETNGCDKCDEAKKAFVLLDKVGFENVSVMCNHCNVIWMLNKTGDERK